MKLPTFLALIIVIVLLLFFGHSGEASAVAVHELNCESDNDCSSGEFCLQSGRISHCSACVDCLRYNKESKGCARSRTDCVKCLPGFIGHGAHCSPRVTEHVMGYRDEQSSTFHLGTHGKSHVILLVCGLLVLVGTTALVLPGQPGAGAGAREEASSLNLLARQGPGQFDPSVTVPRDPLWDSTASSSPETDPVDPTPGPSKSQTDANPSERDEDEHVVPAFDNFVAYDAGNDCKEAIEFALSPPVDPSNPAAYFTWQELQRWAGQSHTGGPDDMESELLPEQSKDFSAISWDEEDMMEMDANEGEDADVDPQEPPPAILQQLGAMDEEYFYNN